MTTKQSPLIGAYEKMFLIRTAEERIAALYLKEKIMSFVHFCVGQEAVAVGVADALTKQDKMLGNHRSHGHYLAKGGKLTPMIAELLGKKGGLARGKGGSMHMIDKRVGFVGSTPILGSAVPLANGVAFAEKYRKSKNVTVVFVGDGGFEEGVVYETLNLAGLFKLPLLIVVENNLHSVNSPIHDRRAERHDTSKIVEGFGARYLQADGNNYIDVRSKADSLVRYLRGGDGPAVLECITYRHMAHSAPIFDENYRTKDTVEQRIANDSIKKLRQELLKKKLLSKAQIESLEKRVVKKVEESIQTAWKDDYPKQNTLFTEVYA